MYDFRLLIYLHLIIVVPNPEALDSRYTIDACVVYLSGVILWIML